MNRPDYDKIMQGEIAGLCGERRKLLLHSCCAPCSSACLERLKDSFDITIFYYNPNIESGEYEVRKAEQIRFLKETGWADFLDCDHDEDAFNSAICGLELEKEGGKRCEVCYHLRIQKTAETAKELGYEYFATTLTVSPLKNSEKINLIGEDVEKITDVKWLHSDFKKRNGYLESIRLAKEYNLYRQNYCGCKFSKRQG
ncbi:MAG: epoxyqueuosine reductase QueH [Clostridia bacterium]|nr:epoxyqueuosine reductase QueH [Clostridia bacterium]